MPWKVVVEIMDFKGSSGEVWEKEDRRAIEKMPIVLGKHVLYWSRTLWDYDSVSTSIKVSDRNEEQYIEYWRKKRLLITWQDVAELTSIGWEKVEFISNELEYLPEEIFQTMHRHKTWFRFCRFQKLLEEKLKKELLSKIWVNKIIKQNMGWGNAYIK